MACTGTAISNNLTMGDYAPVNSVAPVISGATTLGSTLTSTTGTWSNNPATYSYQWYRGASLIGGATSSTYVTVLADSTAIITCIVTATNVAGSANATSNALTMDNYAPVNTVAPVVSGTAVVGQVLTTTDGTWSNSPSSFSYQWKRGVTNVGTNATTYTLVAADAGQSITCVVTGTNAAGSNNATSNALTVLTTLLDVYPTASSAYSIRLLRGARYDNALLRVRRSSDNAEVDVFVDTNYQLSLSSNITSRTSGTTLGTWVGANSAFVTTWYDQSGNNNNAVQATAVNQPTIIASGVLQTNLGKAALLFNGTTAFQTTVNWTNLFATYTVAKLNTLATGVQAFYRDNGSTNSTGIIAFNSVRVDTYRVRTTAVSLSSINSTEFGTTTKLITLSSDAGNGYAYVNNNLRASNAVSGNVGTIMYIGSNGIGNTAGFAGPMSEWITYPSNSNLTAINSNINTYYSVYPIVSDADAQAFIEATGIDSTTQANAINTLVIGMKAQGLWTKMKAIYPMVGGTVDSHKYNLKNPLNTDAAFRLAFFGAWTHTSNGAKPNGTNTYANTFLTPTSTADSAYGVYTTEQLDSGVRVVMSQASAASGYMSPGLGVLGVRGSGTLTGYPNTTKGMIMGFDIDTTTSYYANINGTGQTVTRVFTAFNANTYLIASFSTTIYFTNNNLAFSFIGELANQTEATALRTLVQSFQTTLGRQV
jgi:hypothetical protein